jgi:hypothetical protein
VVDFVGDFVGGIVGGFVGGFVGAAVVFLTLLHLRKIRRQKQHLPFCGRNELRFSKSRLVSIPSVNANTNNINTTVFKVDILLCDKIKNDVASKCEFPR